MFSGVCKHFPPLSFKSTVLIEGQEGAQIELNNRLCHLLVQTHSLPCLDALYPFKAVQAS